MECKRNANACATLSQLSRRVINFARDGNREAHAGATAFNSGDLPRNWKQSRIKISMFTLMIRPRSAACPRNLMGGRGREEPSARCAIDLVALETISSRQNASSRHPRRFPLSVSFRVHPAANLLPELTSARTSRTLSFPALRRLSISSERDCTRDTIA